MDYINTSHPNFIGGTKAVEVAMQQVKSSRIPHPVARPKVWSSLSKYIKIGFVSYILYSVSYTFKLI